MIVVTPIINALGAIVSTPHLAMKFPLKDKQIATIHVDQQEARQCYVNSLRPGTLKEAKDETQRAIERCAMLEL